MSSEEQAYIEDPRETAARASRKLVEGNRKLQLESFKPNVNKFLSAIPTYVAGNLSASMGEFELTTHWHSGHIKLPPDLEQIPNVNAPAVHVKVKLHPQRRGVLYAVGVRGTNLVVCRTELLFDNQGGLTDGGDWVELFSYPSDQEIHPKLAIQDLQRFINRAVEELMEVISGQG